MIFKAQGSSFNEIYALNEINATAEMVDTGFV